jgi:hypothetical protein
MIDLPRRRAPVACGGVFVSGPLFIMDTRLQYPMALDV